MMNKADLERLLVEIHPVWADSEDGMEVSDWLEKNNISEDVFDSVGNSIWSIVVESLVGAWERTIRSWRLPALSLVFIWLF